MKDIIKVKKLDNKIIEIMPEFKDHINKMEIIDRTKQKKLME